MIIAEGDDSGSVLLLLQMLSLMGIALFDI